MAKLFGDKRKEEEITAPFVEASKDYKEKKQKEEERKERLAENRAEMEQKKEAALDYMNRLTAMAQHIAKTKMFNNTPLNLLSVEEIGYGCGLFSLFAETNPQAFIFSEMADAFYALKLYLPSKYKELTVASRFVFLNDPESGDSFIRGFRKGLNESLLAVYPEDYIKADILKELKRIGEKNILSCLYDDTIYNYLHKLGKIN